MTLAVADQALGWWRQSTECPRLLALHHFGEIPGDLLDLASLADLSDGYTASVRDRWEDEDRLIQ
jgi:hypothetical protein